MMTRLVPKIFYARMAGALNLFVGCLGFAVLHQDETLAGPVAAMLIAASVFAGFDAEAAARCASDADCKLVYSSCLCEAVPVSDPRSQLPSDVDCAVNRCRVEHTRAVCADGSCATTSATPPPRR